MFRGYSDIYNSANGMNMCLSNNNRVRRECYDASDSVFRTETMLDLIKLILHQYFVSCVCLEIQDIQSFKFSGNSFRKR